MHLEADVLIIGAGAAGMYAAIEAACRRGLEIFILAFLFRIQAFVLSPGSDVLTLFRVDILNIMGPALVVAALLWGISATNAGVVWSCAAVTLLIAMLTPAVRTTTLIDPLPVWIQDYVGPVGTPMVPTLLARMLQEIPGVDYLKEETALAPQVLTRVRELAGASLQGAMGGMAGRYLLEEYRRGAVGTMPACEVADAHVLVWNALERGADEEARRLHTQLLPLLNYEAMYSFTIYKEVLLRRGVIASARTRVPGAGRLDAENQRELDLLLRDLLPLLTIGRNKPAHA